MKRWIKNVLCISLSLMCLFACVGYAALSGSVFLSGTTIIEPGEYIGLYIYDVAIYSQSGVSSVDYKYTNPTNFESTVSISAQNATVTYEITVHNNTEITYWYLGTKAIDEYGSNDLINSNGGIFITTKDNERQNSTNFDTEDWVPPNTTRTFYATYSFGPNAQGSVSTFVNFSFGMHMDAVQDEFLKILNDKTSDFGYYYLAGKFDKKYEENNKTVIGNVGDDEYIFDDLFGQNIMINMNGETVPVTIMIERKNVDNDANSGDSYSGANTPSGCEYTIYITVDDLDSPGGSAAVYAVSYTCGADGQWYQIGELYEGSSTVVDYDTSDGTYEGAFNVDTWIASEKIYNVTDDISYKVGYEQGTQYDKLLTIEELMSVSDQEFYNKVNNNSGKLLKPVCQILYSYTHNNGQYIESENYNNKYKSGYAALKDAFDRIKPYCLIANGAQEVKIQNANSLSRAELIQMLEAIQHTHDYYIAVNG